MVDSDRGEGRPIGRGRFVARATVAILLLVAAWLVWQWTKPIYDPPPAPQNTLPGP